MFFFCCEMDVRFVTQYGKTFFFLITVQWFCCCVVLLGNFWRQLKSSGDKKIMFVCRFLFVSQRHFLFHFLCLCVCVFVCLCVCVLKKNGLRRCVKDQFGTGHAVNWAKVWCSIPNTAISTCWREFGKQFESGWWQ